MYRYLEELRAAAQNAAVDAEELNAQATMSRQDFASMSALAHKLAEQKAQILLPGEKATMRSVAMPRVRQLLNAIEAGYCAGDDLRTCLPMVELLAISDHLKRDNA